MKRHEIVRRELEQSAEVKRRIDDAMCSQIVIVADELISSLRSGGKVLLFGNGGSAADAQHLAAELVGRYQRERAPLCALALTTNAAVLTALGNDFEYPEVFARQVRALARPGDVAFGLSTSGNSPNVVRALDAGREKGAVTIALTGAVGGACRAVADIVLAVPSTSTPRIQEAHLTIGHILCGLVEHALSEPAPA